MADALATLAGIAGVILALATLLWVLEVTMESISPLLTSRQQRWATVGVMIGLVVGGYVLAWCVFHMGVV